MSALRPKFSVGCSAGRAVQLSRAGGSRQRCRPPLDRGCSVVSKDVLAAFYRGGRREPQTYFPAEGARSASFLGLPLQRRMLLGTVWGNK